MRRWRRLIWPTALAALSLVIIEAVTRIFEVPKWLFPSPTAVFSAFRETLPLLVGHTLATLWAALIGMAASTLAGLALGITVFTSKFLRSTLYPLLVASQSLPTIVVAPLLVLWFGFGMLPKVLLVVLACFFPICVGVVDGLSSVDVELVDLAKSMGARNWRMFWKIRWPASLPSIFTGIRVSATYAIIATVVSEWMGSQKGLGVYLTRSSHSFLTDRVFAVLFVIAGLSMAIFSGVNFLARKAAPWYYRVETDIWEVEK